MNMVPRLLSAVFSLLAFSCVPLLRAQDDGTLHLTVKDPSGAAVEASGAFRNLDSGGERAFQTNAQGSFDFTKLPVSAKRSPARVVPLHHEALPSDKPLVDHRQPGASSLSAAAETMRIGWERHGQSSFLAGYFHNYGVKTGAAAVDSTVVQSANSNA